MLERTELKGRDVPGKASHGVSLKDLEITQKQSHESQNLSRHKKIVEQVKAEARENDEIVTCSGTGKIVLLLLLVKS